jgi:hypothetical protein
MAAKAKRLTVRADQLQPGDSVWLVGEVVDVRIQPGRLGVKVFGLNGSAEIAADEPLGITRNC